MAKNSKKKKNKTPKIIKKNKTIAVLGLGYMGLPTASLLAANGYDVLGVDINDQRVKILQAGSLYFEEPGLEPIFKKAFNSKKLKISSSLGLADIYIISVPTPLNHENEDDLTAVTSAARMVLPLIKKGDLIIIESTVHPHTTDQIVRKILEESGLQAGEDFDLAHCPETAIPGKTMSEIVNNHRIIGGMTPKAAKEAKEIYSSFVKGKMTLTDSTTAESVKLLENTYRDINIALANEFAKIADELGINAWEAIKMANTHPRVNVLQPGPGVGGHCIAIDPWFLTQRTNRAEIIPLARKINNSMSLHVFHLVQQMLKDINNPTIAVLGVAYKADVDDARETPATRFIKLEEEVGWRVKVTDPFVKEYHKEILSLEEAVKDADCLVLITDHSEYKKLNPNRITSVRTKKLLDTRNALDGEKWRKCGFVVRVLGNSLPNNLC